MVSGTLSSLYPSQLGITTDTSQPTYAETAAPQTIRRGRRFSTRVDFESLFHNPYNSVVRGRHKSEYQNSSMSAVRSLLSVVPQYDEDGDKLQDHFSQHPLQELEEEDETISEDIAAEWSTTPVTEQKPGITKIPNRRNSTLSLAIASHRSKGKGGMSPTETASQLAEGTLRALRDLALDEAVELKWALRYWNYRWERPLLSWLEAGPTGEPQVVLVHEILGQTHTSLTLLHISLRRNE
jgi:hypothetical protein